MNTIRYYFWYVVKRVPCFFKLHIWELNRFTHRDEFCISCGTNRRDRSR